MSRHRISLSLISFLAVAALGACSRHPPAETAATPTTPTTPTAPAARAPQAGEPGAAVNALLTDAQLKALQKSRAVEAQVLQQQHDVDKKIDAEAGKD
ncbi:hypothetical protein ELE36_01645 [Pseudolysobacter antarcticus]|uniref:Uncharacterized protein n=1 Tax=Pseudolysobacter antarcticus TaxID=2511995 RepID=A0A411HFC5_9GAMM|nr:hypothetical protein [Pseudolysobacter antarcticus]QBB69182.1 hypothetical protein ELE36_01645 [Pseudolysobacter antarcticus]